MDRTARSAGSDPSERSGNSPPGQVAILPRLDRVSAEVDIATHAIPASPFAQVREPVNPIDPHLHPVVPPRAYGSPGDGHASDRNPG